MRRILVAVTVALLVATLFVGASPASAVPNATAGRAANWVATQQQNDGGFEVAGFPGFETSDAVLALASAAQTGSAWSKAEALSAVEARKPNGKSALDALDDFVDAGVSPAQAAKLIVLVVEPLGLNASDFDPQNDTVAPVNLLAQLLAAAGPDGAYSSFGAAFNAKLYTVLALRLEAQAIPGALVRSITGAQQGNGSWSYDGNRDGTGFDADTTGLAIQALAAAGSGTELAVTSGLRSLAASQQPSGAWQSFGSDDPNSTAVAMLGIAAAGGNVASSCWRDTALPRSATDPYVDPTAWLQSRQAPDGHIISPNDPPVNTFATTQAIEALTRTWLPIAAEPAITCAGSGSGSAGAGLDSVAALRFVDAAYVSLLGRQADPAGEKYFTGLIASGSTPSRVARILAGSTEYRNRILTQLFDRYLGTVPTSAELTSLGAELKLGHRPDVQAELLASSAFFTTKAGSTNAGFVDALYKLLLGRPADRAGLAAWVAAIDSGADRLTVARAIATSGEARSFLVNALYQEYLGRSGDAGGVKFWRGKLGRGTSVETVIAYLVGSSEFVSAPHSS